MKKSPQKTKAVTKTVTKTVTRYKLQFDINSYDHRETPPDWRDSAITRLQKYRTRKKATQVMEARKRLGTLNYRVKAIRVRVKA